MAANTSNDNTEQWVAAGHYLAWGLLDCVVTACVAYIVLWAWPRRHYPPFFAFLACIATVALLYVLDVPGAGLGLTALLFVFYAGMHGLESAPSMFQNVGASGRDIPNLPAVSRPLSFQAFALGALLGFLVSLLAVSALLVPPAYLQRWVMDPESLRVRIERGLSPGDQWVALQDKESSEGETLKKTQAELAVANARLADAEAALSKARDEIGAATSNSVPGIHVKYREGSRHVNGAIYIGVTALVNQSCGTNVSSDSTPGINSWLDPGQAIIVPSGKGKYRVTLVGHDDSGCTYDLIKD